MKSLQFLGKPPELDVQLQQLLDLGEAELLSQYPSPANGTVGDAKKKRARKSSKPKALKAASEASAVSEFTGEQHLPAMPGYSIEGHESVKDGLIGQNIDAIDLPEVSSDAHGAEV